MKKKILRFLFALSLAVPALAGAATPVAKDNYEIGMAIYRKGLYDKAVEYFQKAVEADSQDWEAYEAMGNAYEKLGKSQEALDAYQKSLDIYPGNSTLQTAMENLEESSGLSPQEEDSESKDRENFKALKADHSGISGGEPETKTVVVKRVPGRLGPRVEKIPFNDDLSPINHAKIWTKVELGYNFSTQDDLVDGAAAFNDQITAYGWSGSVVSGRSGYELGFELGFQLDPYSGLALGIRRLYTTDYQVNVNFQPGTASPDFEDATFQNAAWPITLDYYLFMPDPRGRFFLSAGVGYYAGTTHVDESYSFVNAGGTADTLLGDLNAGTFGLQVGVGRDFTINPHFGLSLFAKGRYAKLSNYRGTLVNSSGGEGTFALVKFADGTVDVDQVANISAGETYAKVDFTGFDVGVAFNFYTY